MNLRRSGVWSLYAFQSVCTAVVLLGGGGVDFEDDELDFGPIGVDVVKGGRTLFLDLETLSIKKNPRPALELKQVDEKIWISISRQKSDTYIVVVG
jgi:hypothetical protein